MVWSCYEERKFGSYKNGYGNEHLRKKRKRKTKKKWLDAIECDMRTAGVGVEDVWRFKTQVADHK